ncbi:MAG TPA: hypothetical protein PJ986_10625 [Gammaproteobacteria bacterium]|nr:hypothetical protein [Gammaproteobacteria bacterium]
MIKFPQPVQLGESTVRWRLSDLLRYEAARAGTDPAAVSVGAEQFLRDQQVAERYGVARGSIWRWAAAAREASEAAA